MFSSLCLDRLTHSRCIIDSPGKHGKHPRYTATVTCTKQVDEINIKQNNEVNWLQTNKQTTKFVCFSHYAAAMLASQQEEAVH